MERNEKVDRLTMTGDDYGLRGSRAFFFDLDGTLIDSEKYHADGFAQAVELLSGYRLTEGERREFFESHTSLFTPVLCARHGLVLDPEDVLEYKRIHVRDHFKTEVFPDAMEFIGRWRERKRMALVSNSPRHFVEQALDEAGLNGVFEVVVTADDVEQRKPDPEMVVQALSRMGLEPDQVLVFEDSPAGVEAARAAGCTVWMIKNGSGRRVEGIAQWSWKELLAL